MPVIGRHLAGPNGWIWVPVEGDSTWEVFDDFGYTWGRVTSPVPLDSPPRIVPGAGTITGRHHGRVGGAIRSEAAGEGSEPA